MCRPIGTPSRLTVGASRRARYCACLPGAHPRLLRVSRLDVRGWAQVDFARVSVNDDRVALLDDLGDIGDVADGGNRQRPSDDGDVARRARLLEHKPAQPRPVIVEQGRRAHRARDQDRVLRQFLGQDDETLAGQLMQEPIGDVGQVVQPVAQVGVGLALQPGAGVVMDPLDRGLCGQARTHRLAQPAQPAAIVRDHPERLKDVSMLAADAVVAAVDEAVDRGAHGADRRLETRELGLDVVGHDRRHRHPRLVHHHVPEPKPVGDAEALERQLPPHRDLRALGGDPLQLAGRDHLGEQHSGRLQRLDLFLRIGAPGAVLHDQHPDGRPAPQHRHAEEGLVDLFARLRLVGKGGMVLGVGHRQRLGARGDEADKAFARPHGRQVDGLAIEALGGEQLHRAIGPHHVERAHLGHHVGGDEHDDAVQARLSGDRLRHHLAEPPQQQTRSARRAHQHRPILSQVVRSANRAMQ